MQLSYDSLVSQQQGGGPHTKTMHWLCNMISIPAVFIIDGSCSHIQTTSYAEEFLFNTPPYNHSFESVLTRDTLTISANLPVAESKNLFPLPRRMPSIYV
jgi:hypothetical protein